MNAKEMAATFGVSERTARRHIARGTTPDARRTVGRDGKTYAGSHASYHHGRRSRPYTPLSREMQCAGWRAQPHSHLNDLAEVRTIATEATSLLQEWTIAVEAEQHVRLRTGP